jgi:hypothetical protein
MDGDLPSPTDSEVKRKVLPWPWWGRTSFVAVMVWEVKTGRRRDLV